MSAKPRYKTALHGCVLDKKPLRRENKARLLKAANALNAYMLDRRLKKELIFAIDDIAGGTRGGAASSGFGAGGLSGGTAGSRLSSGYLGAGLAGGTAGRVAKRAVARRLNILLYFPLALEFDMRLLFRPLARRGHRLFLPRIYEKSAHKDSENDRNSGNDGNKTYKDKSAFFAARLSYALRLGPFGTSYPAANPHFGYLADRHLDLIIAPVLGVDSSFARLGFGSGMYDGFVSRCHGRGYRRRHGSKPRLVFISRICLYNRKAFGERHDIKGEVYLSGGFKG